MIVGPKSNMWVSLWEKKGHRHIHIGTRGDQAHSCELETASKCRATEGASSVQFKSPEGILILGTLPLYVEGTVC